MRIWDKDFGDFLQDERDHANPNSPEAGKDYPPLQVKPKLGTTETP